ncbi:MAG: DUF5668 domain-containing protein [Patescibacteria group bacterium]|jgi:hypothetical protein
MFFPILVIVLGLVWLFNNLGIISADVWSVILPVALILAGISMLNKKKCSWCSWNWQGHNHDNDQK